MSDVLGSSLWIALLIIMTTVIIIIIIIMIKHSLSKYYMPYTSRHLTYITF